MKAAEASLSRGDYGTAIQKGTEAIAQLERAGDRKRLGVAENIVGVAHLNRGSYADALPHFLKAAGLAREGADLPAEVRRRNNVGNVYFYLGQYAQAFETYDAALRLLAGAESQPWYPGTRQLTLTNLAVLHQQLGQHQKALDLYKEIRALPLQLKPAVEAQILTNLAIVYRRLGDPQKALETYGQARQLLARDPNAAAALYVLHNVGVVQALDFRDLPAALKTFTEAIAIARRSGSKRELVLEQLFRGETLLLMRDAKAARADFETALAAARELRLVDELWTALYGLGRAQREAGDRAGALRSFQEAVTVIESARSHLGNSSLKAEFLAGKRDVYDALIGELLDQPAPPAPEIFRRMEEGRARNLKELLPAERQAVSLQAVQGALDGQTAVLAYWMAGRRLAVVWATKGAAGVWQRNLEESQHGRIGELGRALARKDSAGWEELAQAVAAILPRDTAPMGDASVRRLVIVPDGTLHLVPFEVLPLGDGRRVVERFAVTYLPSAHFLRPAAAPAARRWPWAVELAAFADPLPGPSGGTTPFDSGWARLPFAAEEAKIAAGALAGRARLHIGAENRKRHVLSAETGRAPVLHFATHGTVDTTDSRRSRLVFTPEPGVAGSQYLFAEEIGRLRLSEVELVTLAACESELGRYVRGEGVENFSRAFLGAGARATVSSLWRVSDRASAEWMGHFYRALAEGETKAESVQRAKLAIMRAGGPYAHPYYWAPYVLSGEGNTPITGVMPWWPLGAVAAVAALLLWRHFS